MRAAGYLHPRLFPDADISVFRAAFRAALQRYGESRQAFNGCHLPGMQLLPLQLGNPRH